MQIDVKQLFENEGQKIPFAGVVDFGDLEIDGLSEAGIEGEVVNRSGIVSVRYSAACRMNYLCDRCLKECTADLEYRFEHTLERALHNEDSEGFIIVPDGMLDIGSLAKEDVILELPSKLLCSPDCKGLCSICGKNLNEEECGCVDDVTDPRLAVLKDLLK